MFFYTNDFMNLLQWIFIFSTKENAMPTTKEEVNQLIASHSIVIFSKTSCPFCKMAKQVLVK